MAVRALSTLALAAVALCAMGCAKEPAPAAAPATETAPAALAPFGDDDRPWGFRELEIGAPAPAFELPGIDGRTYTLADFSSTPYLMVFFTSNHCPTSHAVMKRLLPFVREMAPRGLGVVAINPNHPDGLRVDELGFGKYNDSFEEMTPYAKEAGFTFPYLYDGEAQGTAKAYGCLATPHVFLFDRERKLRYSGRFDNSAYEDAATVTKHDTRDALEAMMAGKPVAVPQTRPHGCSTKWREKRVNALAADEAWKHAPVTLESIGKDGVAKLRENATDKWRVINVWATWCAPCVREFPELVRMSRRMAMRDFELITLSTDDPKQREPVLRFLEARHAAMPDSLQESVSGEGRATNNYLYDSTDMDALAQALDAEWPGGVPHTVLVAPGGRIVWRQTGEIDMERLWNAIFENMGTVYRPQVAQK